ncbi:MAG: hypothetical protein ABH864_05700 [archaeon]
MNSAQLDRLSQPPSTERQTPAASQGPSKEEIAAQRAARYEQLLRQAEYREDPFGLRLVEGESLLAAMLF